MLLSKKRKNCTTSTGQHSFLFNGQLVFVVSCFLREPVVCRSFLFGGAFLGYPAIKQRVVYSTFWCWSSWYWWSGVRTCRRGVGGWWTWSEKIVTKIHDIFKKIIWNDIQSDKIAYLVLSKFCRNPNARIGSQSLSEFEVGAKRWQIDQRCLLAPNAGVIWLVSCSHSKNVI